MHHFNSRNVPEPQRMDIVNDTISAWSDGRLSWEADRSTDFNVEMSRTPLGKAMFSVHRSTGGRLVNRPSSAAPASTYFIHAALHGAQDMEVDGVRIRLEEGEHTLTHATKSCVREAGDDITVACLSVPADVMKHYVPNPERAVGHIFAAEGLTGSISRILQSMLEMEQTRTLDAFGGRIALHTLDLFGLCTQAIETDASAVRDDWLHRIRGHVRANIHDPDLSVASVAERFAISTRYLHMLFAGANDSLSSFIRYERLERCRAELEDPNWRYRSISDLAYAWGFNDLSNFCRTFRREYGVSARDYRRRALLGPAALETGFNA